MPSPPHPRLRNRHSLPPALSNGAHPSDYAARELWTAIPCDSLEYRRVVPTSESPTIRDVWSAASPQAKCEDVTSWSAQMYTAFVGVNHSWPGWNALRSLPH